MNREKELLTRMAGTIVAMVICLAAMGFSAFAYFSHSISSGINVIQAAHFDVIVTDMTGVTEAGGESGTVLEGNMYVCGRDVEDADKSIYTFTLEYAGTAETGYCMIEILDGDTSLGTFYTEQIFKTGDAEKGHLTKINVKIEAKKGYTIKFTPQWGTSKYYLSDTETLYDGNSIIYPNAAIEDSRDESEGETVSGTDNGTESDGGEITHTVMSGETLTIIANKYNTTVDALVAYNQIEDADKIGVEQVIKIPPADWVMPSEAVE